MARFGELDVDGRMMLKNKGMRAFSAFGRLSLEGGGHGDELFCSVKHEGFFFTLDYIRF